MQQSGDFMWAVALDGYEWFELYPSDFSRPGYVLTPRALTREFRYYAPLRQYPGLHRTFSSLEAEATPVEEFANRYGLLGGRLSVLVPVPHEPVRQTNGEFLEDWWLEIAAIRRLVSLWDELLTAAKSGIQPQIAMQGSDSVLVNPGGLVIASTANDAPLFKNLDPLDTLRPAWSYLQQQVNSKLESHNVVPRLALEQGRLSLTCAFIADSLLGAIWTDFSLSIAQGKGSEAFKQCEVCGRFFEKVLARRRDAIYCSDACKSKAYRRRQ